MINFLNTWSTYSPFHSFIVPLVFVILILVQKFIFLTFQQIIEAKKEEKSHLKRTKKKQTLSNHHNPKQIRGDFGINELHLPRGSH
jgi:hypothetical protein